MLEDEAGPRESTRARNFSQLFLRRMGRAKRNPSPPHLGTDGTMGFASLYPSYEGRTWPQVRRPHWCDVTVAVCRARDRPHVGDGSARGRVTPTLAWWQWSPRVKAWSGCLLSPPVNLPPPAPPLTPPP